MGKNIEIRRIFILLLPLFTFACVKDNMVDSCTRQERPVEVWLEVTAKTNTRKTRAAADDAEERKIYSLLLAVFDSEGERELLKEYSYEELLQAAEAAGNGDAEAPTGSGLLRIPLTTGEKTFFLAANYDAEKSGGIYEIDLDALRNMTALTDLDRIKAEIGSRTIFRTNGMFLMSAAEKADVTENNQRISIGLVRSDAKITFDIGTGTGVEFEPLSYKVMNIPVTAYVRAREKGVEKPEEWDASTEDAADYFNSLERYFEGEDGNTLTFYMPESRRLPRRLITTASEGYDPDRLGYNLREKQEKIENTSDKGADLLNGDYIYAPQYAPYVEFSGNLTQILEDGTRRNGRITYRVHLGYTSPTDAVNDYDVERNTHYTYKITILGADDIRIEASSDKEQEEEPAPGVEGTIYDSDNDFVLDAHYEQVLLKFNKKRLGIFDSAGNLASDASLAFVVQTPFCNAQVTYTREELRNIFSEEIDYVPEVVRPELIKAADTEWLHFYVEDPNLSNVSSETMTYYTDTGAKLMNLEQFLYKMMFEPDNVFNRYTQECKVTLFIDEYFYERRPMQENASRDKNLWVEFANAADRTFDLLVNTSREVSPDGNSRYHKSIFSIRQTSIKTVFVKSPVDDNIHVWGIESVNETPDLQWTGKTAGTVWELRASQNSNGWINTWRIMAGRHYLNSRFDKEPMPDACLPATADGNAGKNLWKNLVLTEGGKLSLNSQHYGLLGKQYNPAYASFAPMLRNRDENRDGYLQARELKWYIPSNAELAALFICERALPGSVRLEARQQKTGTQKYTPYFASTSYTGHNRDNDYATNPLVFWAEAEGNSPLIEFYEGNGLRDALSPADRLDFSEIRCIRDLGVLDEEDTLAPSYHLTEAAKTERVALGYYKGTENRKFYMDNVDPIALRIRRAIYELPAHNERSDVNSIYAGGFEVAKELAKDADGKNYYKTWTELQHDIETENSPCQLYSQEAGGADRGTWRVPNQAEALFMAYNLFDWFKAEMNEVYQFDTGNEALSVSSVTPWFILTRTGYSGSSEETAARSYSSGYFIRQAGRYRIVNTTVCSSYFSENQKGYVRCVRDN